MSEIQPIDDAYIKRVIKAIDAYNPNLSKTQGVRLRERIKLMRDRFEQRLATVPSGSTTESVQSYAAMLANGVPNSMTTYEVATDEKRNITNSIYQWWPDGKLFFIYTVTEPDPTLVLQALKLNLTALPNHTALSDWNNYDYGIISGFLNNIEGTTTGIKFIVDNDPVITEDLGFDPPATTNFPGSVSSSLWYQEAAALLPGVLQD